MPILIGHASIDENGKTKGGSAGDQTKKEVCTRAWYSKPWDYVLRCKDRNKAEKMAIACEKGCANDNIGYDQNQRNTLYTQAKSVNYDLGKITMPCECDCSSFMTVCAQAAGIDIPYNSGNAPTTSTMKNAFVSTGEFDVLTNSKYLTSDKYLKRGDILVKSSSHTVMALENGEKATNSKIGVDVSSYQSPIGKDGKPVKIDWNAVKTSGIDFAILKIIRKDLEPDKQFENNWKGCENAGMTIQGVYNYSYATTVEKARTDANKVLQILNGRKTMVWLDVEDECQKNLGARLISIINAYAKVIQDAGLEFGVYTGESFYNSYIKPYGGLKYPLWIARYGKNTGEMDSNYQPQIDGMVGWQYTSKGSVNGIIGNVDMNVWYKELSALNQATDAHNGNSYPEPIRLLYKANPLLRGEDVKWLQYELIRHGCLPENNAKGELNIDGILGNDTSNAIYAFQRQAGITADGKCGAVTRTHLKK